MIMKKVLTLSIACLLGLNAMGQEVTVPGQAPNIDLKEDTAEIVTIDDIIKTQERITYQNSMDGHFRDVWSRKSYLNLCYNSSTLAPKSDIPNGLGGLVPEYKSNWGASLVAGTSYNLHKKPIANILQFNIDYNYVELGVNHFAIEGDGKNLYDSRNKTPDGDFYRAWGLEKYDINYGMAVGPSVTVAPFTYLQSKGLHYIKFHLYYHLGYHASLLYYVNKEDADMNPTPDADQEKMRKDGKLDLGHGLTHTFGFGVSWKFIGVGYEHRSASVKYKSIGGNSYGSEKLDFKNNTSRVFLQFRM